MDIPKIQWYPGHIAKAEKKLSEVINKVDLVIEVRDARIPLSTGHPHLNKWINNKKQQEELVNEVLKRVTKRLIAEKVKRNK